MKLHDARPHFPVLANCVYLNSNSTGATPRAVRSALARYYSTLSSWRDEAVTEWWNALQEYENALARFIGAPTGTIATDSNLSVLLGRLLTCFDFRGSRRKIVTTDLAFPTIPFIARAFSRYGAELVVVETDGRSIDESRLIEAIDERTAVVCVSHASFATGALLDAASIAERTQAAGAWFVLDAYQSVGVVPLDVIELGCDALLGGAHKWMCGSFESAFIYAREDRLAELKPAATGWVAGNSPLSFGHQDDWAPDARRLRAGTPLILPALISQPGLDILTSIGAGTVRRHSLALTDRIMNRADEAGIEVLTPRPAQRRAGVVALQFPGDRNVTERLIGRGFVCSHRGSLRVAPHFYNTIEEVDHFMDALLDERRHYARSPIDYAARADEPAVQWRTGP